MASGNNTLLTGMVPPSNNLWGTLTIPVGPTAPTQTLSTATQAAEDRFDKRLLSLRDILPISKGRVVPGEDDLIIGDARRLHLAVLFLDICQFSQIPSTEDDEQDRVLQLVNLFMSEMLSVVRQFGGHFEKNTGDGLMAYFKESTLADSARQALDAAITMHHRNDNVISPRLRGLGLPEVKFRIGLETGSVVVANVGVRGGNGDHRSLVAIGTTANIACKLMNLIPQGGIVLGNYARWHLTKEWQDLTAAIDPLPGFVIKGTSTPYPAWELTYRAPATNTALARLLMGGLGGL